MMKKGNRQSVSTDIRTYMDFLQLEDGKFIMWRLLRAPEDDAYWAAFLEEHQELKAEFERAVAVCDSIRLNERHFKDTNLIYERIQDSIRASRQRRAKLTRLYRRVAVAAAFVSVLLIPAFYYTVNRNSALMTGHHDEFTAQILQGENVELVVDHRRIVLQDSANVWIKNGKICYDDRASDAGYASVTGRQCRMIVPPGRHSFLTLADLSKVWVNSGSEIIFASDFSQPTRDITVNGEIYIDVTKNDKQPFIVHTSTLDVVVHGTSFNVSAYHDEGEVSVVLVKGKVQVCTHTRDSMWLQPSERLALSDGRLSKQTVDISYYTSWREGYFTFEETPVHEVLRKIGKYYNIHFDDRQYASLSGKRITGKLYLSKDLDDVLASIALITSTTYTRDHDTITFIKNRKETMPMKNAQ